MSGEIGGSVREDVPSVRAGRFGGALTGGLWRWGRAAGRDEPAGGSSNERTGSQSGSDQRTGGEGRGDERAGQQQAGGGDERAGSFGAGGEWGQWQHW